MARPKKTIFDALEQPQPAAMEKPRAEPRDASSEAGPAKAFLIDGDHRMFKAFYAVPGLTTPSGEPINLVYGFIGTLLKLLREEKPSHLAVAFDTPEPTFRHQAYPAYKATRKPTPAEFLAQVPKLHRLLEAMRIPMLRCPGYEADDILATLATRWGSEEMHVYVATGDKDARQLINEHVSLYDLDNMRQIGPTELDAEMGLKPEQVIEYMALVGDTVDNISGVPKVGEKTALPLIQEYGSLNNLYAHLDEIESNPRIQIRGKAGVVKRLREHEEEARLAHELVILNRQAPLEVELDEIAVQPLLPKQVLPIFQEYGFTTYVRDLALIETPTREIAQQRYRVIDTLEGLDSWLAEVAEGRAGRALAVDTETSSPDAFAAELVGLSFSLAADCGVYLPLKGPQGAQTLPREKALAKLRPILEDPAVPKVGHNLKYDWLVLRRAGVHLRGIVGDSMIAAYLLHPGRARLGLDHLAVEFLFREVTPIESLIGSGKKKKDQKRLDELPVEEVALYAAEDADVAGQLHETLLPQLKRDGLLELYRTLEIPLLEVLAEMEWRGITVDRSVLERLREEMRVELAEIEQEIYRQAGRTFNIRSTKQLADLLFEERGHTPIKKTKSGPSTDEYVLEALARQEGKDPLPGKILEYRTIQKLLSTYVEALPKYVREETNRVHTSFHQVVTPTGRLSSADPNLQNIPIRSEHGRRIRRAFVPGAPDGVLVALDYSQVELRLVAEFSNEPALIEAFEADKDVHRAVAARIFGVAEELVTPAQRSDAKAVNFGIIYGQTAFGLANATGMSKAEAQAFIDDYFERFPGVRRYIDETIHTAHERGYVTTLLGRRRYLPDLKLSNKVKRARAEREAVNTTVQGSAADLIKQAMVELHRRIEAEQRPVRMLLQIHDELIFECPRESVDEETAVARQVMEKAVEMRVPLKVDASWGTSWLEAK